MGLLENAKIVGFRHSILYLNYCGLLGETGECNIDSSRENRRTFGVCGTSSLGDDFSLDEGGETS